MEVVRVGPGTAADDDGRWGRLQGGTERDEVSVDPLRERSLISEPVTEGEGSLGGEPVTEGDGPLGGEPAVAVEGPLGGELAAAGEGSQGEGLLCRAGDSHISTRSL